jgi:hypothetical protein
MYLTQIKPKTATGFYWLSSFADAAINTIASFQKPPFLPTSPICVKYILPFYFSVGQLLSVRLWQNLPLCIIQCGMAADDGLI